MEHPERVITRRDFIRTGSCLAVGGLIGFPLTAGAASNAAGKSRVVLIRDGGVIEADGRLDEKILDAMLDEAVVRLLECPDPQTAWRQLFRKDDIVGIKSNVWGPLATPAPLEEMLKNRLMAIGIRGEHISVDDRGIRENPVFKRATALINVRPMRTHHWAGVGTLLKNYIMFVPQPWTYHGNACERLGAIWQLPGVRGKTRLNILVMLTPLFHGAGPHHFSRQYVWPYRGLIASTDPVAADATGAGIIQAKRNEHFGEQRPIRPPPRHIEAADKKYGLGNSHPERIELIRLGWEEGVLV